MTGMLAAVLHASGDLRIEEREVPVPAPGHVLVRVAVCGVCGSDATEFARGPVLTRLPVTLGHEFAGVVEAPGEGVAGFAPGSVVVCGAGISCGTCRLCREGRTNLCREYRTAGLQVDGGLAGYVSVPAATLLDVSDSGLPLDTLGLAQPMAIAVHAVRRSALRAGQDAVIVGVGGIGAFITFAAASTGARVLVVDLDPARLQLAQRLGASATLVAGGQTLADRIDELGFDPDVFFEVSGSAPGLSAVLEAARPGATIVPVGIQSGLTSVPLGRWTLDEFTIVGTVAHVVSTDLPEAVRLLGAREDWTDVAHKVLPIRAVVESALRPLIDGTPDQVKTLIDPWAVDARPAIHEHRG